MKNFLFIIIVIETICLIICGSCKKSNTANNTNIIGTWKWVDTYYDYPLNDSNPLNPANSGIQETLIFNSDLTWKKIQNNVIVDSGTYSTGHGTYLPYPTAKEITYDSVRYYKTGQQLNIYDFYEIINDTLSFDSALAGSFSFYLGSNGYKQWVRQ